MDEDEAKKFLGGMSFDQAKIEGKKSAMRFAKRGFSAAMIVLHEAGMRGQIDLAENDEFFEALVLGELDPLKLREQLPRFLSKKTEFSAALDKLRNVFQTLVTVDEAIAKAKKPDAPDGQKPS